MKLINADSYHFLVYSNHIFISIFSMLTSFYFQVITTQISLRDVSSIRLKLDESRCTVI